MVLRKAAGAAAAGAAAADAAKLLRGAHVLSTQDASRERATPSLFVRRAFEHDAYEFDAARDDDDTIVVVVDRAAFSNTIVVVVARSETTHLRAARNAPTTADNDMTISKPFNAPAWCERHEGKEWEDTNGEE